MAIIFDCCGKVEEAQKNTNPKIGKEVCPSIVEAVWRKVSEFVQDKLSQGRGVRIPGFVTFNYKSFTRAFNQKQVLVERIPHMILHKDIIKSYDLISKRPLYNFELAEVPLNLTQISLELGIPRTCAEICIDEVLQAFKRALVTDTHVEFHFHNIGRLVIQKGEVEPYFCKEFMTKYCFGTEIIKDKGCPKYP